MPNHEITMSQYFDNLIIKHCVYLIVKGIVKKGGQIWLLKGEMVCEERVKDLAYYKVNELLKKR